MADLLPVALDPPPDEPGGVCNPARILRPLPHLFSWILSLILADWRPAQASRADYFPKGRRTPELGPRRLSCQRRPGLLVDGANVRGHRVRAAASRVVLLDGCC